MHSCCIFHNAAAFLTSLWLEINSWLPMYFSSFSCFFSSQGALLSDSVLVAGIISAPTSSISAPKSDIFLIGSALLADSSLLSVSLGMSSITDVSLSSSTACLLSSESMTLFALLVVSSVTTLQSAPLFSTTSGSILNTIPRNRLIT